MKTLTNHTNDELRARINKGQKMLDTAHKVMFTAWTNGYSAETGRSVAKFRKQDLLNAYTAVADLYRKQCALRNQETFDTSTLSFGERARVRARVIKSHMEAAKQQAFNTGNTVVLKIKDLRS